MQVLLSDSQVSLSFFNLPMVFDYISIHSNVDRLHCSREIPISHRPKRNFTSPGRSYLIITSSRASSHIQYLSLLYRVPY